MRGGFKSITPIAAASMAFSVISILISIIRNWMQREVLNLKGYAVVTWDVTGKAITSDTSRCQRSVNRVKKQISSLLGLNSNLIEVLKPQEIQNGLKLIILVHVDRISDRDVDYEKILKDAQRSGALTKLLMDAWKINNSFVCSNLSFEIKESQQWIANTVSIKIDNTAKPQLLSAVTSISQSEMAAVPNRQFSTFAVHGTELADAPKINAIVTPGSLTAGVSDYTLNDKSVDRAPEDTGMRQEGEAFTK